MLKLLIFLSYALIAINIIYSIFYIAINWKTWIIIILSNLNIIKKYKQIDLFKNFR